MAEKIRLSYCHCIVGVMSSYSLSPSSRCCGELLKAEKVLQTYVNDIGTSQPVDAGDPIELFQEWHEILIIIKISNIYYFFFHDTSKTDGIINATAKFIFHEIS